MVRPDKRPSNKTVLYYWLRQHGKTQEWMRRQLGCSFKMIMYWSHGRVMPSLVYAFAIERITGGGVPVSSWLGTTMGRLAWAKIIQRAKGRA